MNPKQHDLIFASLPLTPRRTYPPSPRPRNTRRLPHPSTRQCQREDWPSRCQINLREKQPCRLHDDLNEYWTAEMLHERGRAAEEEVVLAEVEGEAEEEGEGCEEGVEDGGERVGGPGRSPSKR